MSKPRIIRDYEKISDEIKEQLKLVYPKGYHQHLISYSNKDGLINLGLPFETEEAILIIKMSKVKAVQIVEDDEDFDQEGVLKQRKKNEYEDKYDDVEYLTELNDNDDNEFGFEMEDE